MSLETIINFAALVASPDECIYALVNDEDKRVQIYSTKSFLSHLLKIVKESKLGCNGLMGEDTKKIRVVILETVLGKDTRFLVSKYRTQYRDLGYSPYKSYRDANYKLVIELVAEGVSRYGVYLRGYNENTLLGEFKRYDEAKRYVDSLMYGRIRG